MSATTKRSGWNDTENQFIMGDHLTGQFRKGRYVLRQWPLLMVLSLLGGAFGWTYSLYSPPTYQARVNFVIEESKQSAGGLFSTLAGQMGMDLSALSGSSGILAGDNVLQLLKSPTLLKKVLLTTGPDTTATLALLYARSYKLEPAYTSILPKGQTLFPKRADTIASLGRVQDSLLEVITQRLLTKEIAVYKPDRKLSFFSLEVTTRHEVVSEQIANKLIQEASSLYILTKTRRLKTNVERLQKKSDSIAILLNKETYRSAATNLYNANPAETDIIANIDISAREKALLGIIYADLNKSLELTRTALIQETPTIEIVDKPTLPLKRTYITPAIAAVMGLLAGFVLCVSWLLVSSGRKGSAVS